MKNSFNIGGGAIIVIFFIIVSVLLITFVYNTNTQTDKFGNTPYYAKYTQTEWPSNNGKGNSVSQGYNTSLRRMYMSR